MLGFLMDLYACRLIDVMLSRDGRKSELTVGGVIAPYGVKNRCMGVEDCTVPVINRRCC